MDKGVMLLFQALTSITSFLLCITLFFYLLNKLFLYHHKKTSTTTRGPLFNAIDNEEEIQDQHGEAYRQDLVANERSYYANNSLLEDQASTKESSCFEIFVVSEQEIQFKDEGKTKEKWVDDEEKCLFVIDPSCGKICKKFHAHDGESLTGESTSKSSTEWRSSTIFRDSDKECIFSSSSRRSSSKWESFALFRKYDEDMLYLDKLCAQKLNEAESLKSIAFQPRSISQRITQRFTKVNKKVERRHRDPYQELESAYVAQICLTWEALIHNYNSFQLARRSEKIDSGCPEEIAQQFQQFQVLLQRFIENEPYECGPRPEVHARIRISSPMLLQVPEFTARKGEECTKISSREFSRILQDVVQTFMNFLKADREPHCRILRAFMRKKQIIVDANHLYNVKKDNKRKKWMLKKLGQRRKCLKKRRREEEEEEIHILMGLIDMKIVSRVLRMPQINEEQLHWCEEKIKKLRICDGKLHRDSPTLLFPTSTYG